MFQIESKMFRVLEKMKKKMEIKSNENTIVTKNRSIFQTLRFFDICTFTLSNDKWAMQY